MRARPGVEGRIGPNALIRIAEAIDAGHGARARDAVFAAAGLAHRLERMPEDMVEEDEVRRLHAALADVLGATAAERIAADAGRRTAEYLLAHRIPRAAQTLLGVVPAGLAARILLGAIGRHAWTFAGSGAFSFAAGRPLRLQIAHSPVCADPAAAPSMRVYYAATFARVFEAILRRRVRVDVVDGPADGCRMALAY